MVADTTAGVEIGYSGYRGGAGLFPISWCSGSNVLRWGCGLDFGSAGSGERLDAKKRFTPEQVALALPVGNY